MGQVLQHSRNITATQGVNIKILELKAGVDPFEFNEDDVISEQSLHNLWVLAGRNWLRDHITGDETGTLGYFAAGSGSAAVLDSDTALSNETVRGAWIKTTKSDSQIVFQYLITGNNGNVFREGGAFDAASGGTMYNRFLYTAITKSSANQILYQVTILLQEA